MALITRIARLFRADLHAVLDRIEEPEALLKQSVREMEEITSEGIKKLKLLRHEIKHIDSSLEILQCGLIDVKEELDICFESNNKELIRVKIRHQMELQRNQNFLTHKRSRLDESLIEITQRIEENNSRLMSIRQKIEILESRNPSDQIIHRGQNVSSFAEPISDEDIEVEYLRQKKMRNL